MNGPIAVLAGTRWTPGWAWHIWRNGGCRACRFPSPGDPGSRLPFSTPRAADKRRQALAVLRGAMAQGCRRAFVYCNSLSAAVDFPGLAEETGMRIVTPLGRVPAAGAPLPGAGSHRRQRPGTLRHREGIAGGQSRPGSAGGLCAAGGAGRGGGDAAGGAGGNATVWRRWQRGLPTAGWRRWCWAAPISPILRRPWRPGQGCRWWTRRRRCSAC